MISQRVTFEHEIQNSPEVDSVIQLDGRAKREEVLEITRMAQADLDSLRIKLESSSQFKQFIETEYKYANEGYLKPLPVSAMQMALNRSFPELDPISLDNDFGVETFTRLIKFQKENDLTPDGICGPLTKEVLFGEVNLKEYNPNENQDIKIKPYRKRYTGKSEIASENDSGSFMRIFSSVGVMGFFKKLFNWGDDNEDETQMLSQNNSVEGGITLNPEVDLSNVDFRGLKDVYRNEASVKNNNPAGLTYNRTFASTLTRHGVKFYKGSHRPRSEGGNYFGFENMAEGMKAFNILWDIKINNSNNKTFGDFASNWAQDTRSYRGIFADVWNTRLSDLNESEINVLKAKQMQIESPGMYTELRKIGAMA